jgi:hypothetical protein
MNRSALISALCAAVLIQAYVVYYIFIYGPLRGAVPYDDCGVILRSLENLDALAGAHTIGEFLSRARHLTIHSPVSDFQTMAGLMFTGGATWGPYALDAVWPAVALIAVATTAGARNVVFFVAVAAFLLLSPFVLNGSWWLKSDWEGGIFLAAAMLVLFDAAESGSVKGKIVGSSLLALALLCKMTAFYQPAPVLATFFAFELYGALKQRWAQSTRTWLTFRTLAGFEFSYAQAKLWALCSSIILAPYLFFFWYSRRHLVFYINMALDSAWRDNFTVVERLLFYMPFGTLEARDAWGALHMLFPVLFAMAMLTAGLKWQRSHLFVGVMGCAIIVMFFLPVVVASTSEASFAGVALGAVAGAALVCMRTLDINLPRYGAWIGLAVILALAPFSRLPFTSRNEVNGVAVQRDDLKKLHRIQTDLAFDVAQTPLVRPKIVYAFDNVLAPVTNLAIDYFWHTGRFADVGRVDDLSQKAQDELASSDFVISLVPAEAGKKIYSLYPRWPLSADPSSADVWIRGSGHFKLVKSYTTGEGEIRLYSAVASSSVRR